MAFYSKFVAGAALAVMASYASAASAQGSGSMQVGNTTVSVGAGTAILTLPDVQFLTAASLSTSGTIRKYDDGDDFGDEIGFNVNGSVSAPMTGANGRRKRISINGFFSSTDDEDSAVCTESGFTCTLYNIVDDSAIASSLDAGTGNAGAQFISSTDRDVDHWGVSLESQWYLNPQVMGVTQAPPQRYFALGAGMRRIDQDLSIVTTSPQAAGAFRFTYSEDLETDYYGAYAAWGGDYSPFLFKGLWDRWGLRSSFRLRGGAYYADTDYSGSTVSTTAPNNLNGSLSLSQDEIAFIGGLTLETRKRIGARTMLSLKSEYEYYSWVPDMRYNDSDYNAGGPRLGQNRGTSIGSDDAFSARTSLRLTIKLGPAEIMEPMK